MQETWATSASLDLHLELAGTRPRAALESALRDAVRAGRLAAGTSLPSSRALAADLGLARNTVADAYAQLVAEGWLAARHGSGTWVAERSAQVPLAAAAAGRAAAARTRFDLRPGLPDVAAFPRTAWLAAARRAIGAAQAREFVGYGDTRGLLVLRAALAEYLARARGVSVTPDRVIVCAGFAQGFGLLCDLLRNSGRRTLAVEGYGHQAHRRVAAAKGMRLVSVPVDDSGAVFSSQAPRAGSSGQLPEGSRSPAPSADLDSAAAALLTPAHQYPLGVALAPQRRRDAIEWAASGGRFLVEDDYDGEFRYDRQAVGALQALAPEQVVYAGTASKSLVPGLRLGWLVLPDQLVDDVVAIKAETGQLSSSLDQLTLAELIMSGGYDRQVRRARLAYRQRRDRLVSALSRQVPEVTVSGIAAGLHAVVRLPPGVSEAGVIERAAARGLALTGLAECRAGDEDLGPALTVGYATPPAHAFSMAIARLCAVLRDSM